MLGFFHAYATTPSTCPVSVPETAPGLSAWTHLTGSSSCALWPPAWLGSPAASGWCCHRACCVLVSVAMLWPEETCGFMLMRPGLSHLCSCLGWIICKDLVSGGQWTGILAGQGTSSTTGKEGTCVVTHAYPQLAPLLWDFIVGVTIKRPLEYSCVLKLLAHM